MKAVVRVLDFRVVGGVLEVLIDAGWSEPRWLRAKDRIIIEFNIR